MKHRDLEKRLRKAGCYKKREGASHTIGVDPQTGVRETVPRHREIKEDLAKKILRRLGALDV